MLFHVVLVVVVCVDIVVDDNILQIVWLSLVGCCFFFCVIMYYCCFVLMLLPLFSLTTIIILLNNLSSSSSSSSWSSQSSSPLPLALPLLGFLLPLYCLIHPLFNYSELLISTLPSDCDSWINHFMIQPFWSDLQMLSSCGLLRRPGRRGVGMKEEVEEGGMGVEWEED